MIESCRESYFDRYTPLFYRCTMCMRLFPPTPVVEALARVCESREMLELAKEATDDDGHAVVLWGTADVRRPICWGCFDAIKKHPEEHKHLWFKHVNSNNQSGVKTWR